MIAWVLAVMYKKNYSPFLIWSILQLYFECLFVSLSRPSHEECNIVRTACVQVCLWLHMCCKFMLRWGLSLRLIHGQSDKKHRESESASSHIYTFSPTHTHTQACTHSTFVPSFITSTASQCTLHPSLPLSPLPSPPFSSLQDAGTDSQAAADVGGN